MIYDLFVFWNARMILRIRRPIWIHEYKPLFTYAFRQERNAAFEYRSSQLTKAVSSPCIPDRI
jgi:hypothetical protein